jgi:signal transduction histidine kinase/ligand-binding sensor domain-containing protein/AraC-like DNA-binding protein/ActR/RegA family two-component response regulator
MCYFKGVVSPNLSHAMRYPITIGILLLLTPGLSAQRPDYSFINFSSKDGLSSNSVFSILKDRYGYMWFATDDGIDKFDGLNFTAYRHSSTDSHSIGAGSVMAMQEDRSGNLWVGTGQTLSVYDREKDRFINFDFSGHGSVRSLCADHTGKIWVGTYGGLYLFDPQSRSIKDFQADPASPDHLMSNAIICIFEDSQNRVWIGTIAGLHLYRDNGHFKRFLYARTDPNSIPDSIVRTIAEDTHGRIWIGTNDGGIAMLRADGRSFDRYQNSPSGTSTLSSNRIYAIAVENSGKLWLGTEEGLNIFDPGSGQVLRIANDPRNKYSLKGKSVRSICLGQDGIYWIGTYQGGINKYDKNLAFFNLRESDPFDDRGLSSPKVTSFVEDAGGDIYIGTDGGGLNLYHPRTGLIDHIPLSAGEKGMTQSILTLERLGREVWIGTYGDGVYVLDMTTHHITHFVQGAGPGGLSSNDIFCIRKDNRGNIWIGNNGDGLDMYEPRSGRFYRVIPDKRGSAEDRLPLNGFVRSVEEDKAGNIWIGSNGTGIAVFSPTDSSFKLLNLKNSNLPSDFVLDIHCDAAGNMWVGTMGGGLSVFDARTGKFISYSETEGLSNAVVYKILEDHEGKLWVSTNKGISSFDLKNRQFKNYTHYNGLQRNPFNRGSGLRTSGGEMYFGGLDGFNYFNPVTLHSNRNVPALVFTDLKISNRSIAPGENSPIRENISVASQVKLSYRQNFSLDFVALNYTAPQESQYYYKLEGFDNDWNRAGRSKTAVYTNLDPGKYVFRLKAKSDDGGWNTPEKTIEIFVIPPFWRTVYAYFAYVAAAAFILWLLRRQGIRRIKNKFAAERERNHFRQMIEMERQEAERKREFDLLKIKFLTNLSHEFRTPISLIMEPAENLLQAEINPKKVEQLSLIRRNGRRLLNLVNQLLDFRKLEENELKLNLSEGDLVSFIRDVGDSFKDISERKHINFAFTSFVSHFYTRFDRDKIERILFNLLSNAFKFTRADGRIWVSIEQDHEQGVRIVISDTGIGMGSDVREKIFERFFQGDANTAIMNQGSGIGLSITKEFVALHGGTIEVESIQGKGSIFTVRLPCKPIHKALEEVITGSADEKRRPCSDLPEGAVAGGLEKPTVLLIEDHEDFLHYLGDHLNSYYKVIEAVDGKQGWQKVLSTHPQVIVSDINMPEMDGIELCRKIKADKRTSHIPVILLTALTGDDYQLRGLNTGASDYLTKPFKFEILNIKIRNLLNLNQNLKTVYSKQLRISTPETEVQSGDEKLLVHIVQYIESNIYNPDLSVEELSKHVFMSRGSLYNKILALTGETPVEFIRSVKLNKAAHLLEHSDMKISQVGYEVGFTSPNYFARAFKAKFNLSPTEYVHLKRNSR